MLGCQNPFTIQVTNIDCLNYLGSVFTVIKYEELFLNILPVFIYFLDNGRTRPIPRAGSPPLPEPQEHMCLVRAKSRSKKIATVIHQKDINKFQVAYSNLLKGNLDGLKKLKKLKTKTKTE